MPELPSETIQLLIPPWPTYRASNFRKFEHDEKHITRISAEYVLLLMLERSLHFTESGRDVEVGEGEWYIQVPGLLQEGRVGSPAPFYYYIHFSAASDSGPKQDESGPVTPEPSHRLSMAIRGRFEPYLLRPLFERLDVISKRRPSDILSLQSVFLDILHQVSSSAAGSDHPSRRVAHDILNYLAAHYNQPLTGKDLAEHFHYSYDYIQRLLKRYFGTTPWQYVQSYRIKRAQELLENTDLPVPAVASEVGYNDETVFYKAFRKQTGDAPGIWRRKKRGLL